MNGEHRRAQEALELEIQLNEEHARRAHWSRQHHQDMGAWR